MKSIKITFAALSTIILMSCGGKEEKKGKFQYDVQPETTTKTTTETTTTTDTLEVVNDSIAAGANMENKGIGPITSYTFEEEVNTELAAKGEAVFKQMCTACHKTEQKLIGPPVKGIFERRSVEWVMNMILNPEQMLNEDPIAMELLKEHNNVRMLDQNLTEEDTKALVEYFRTL